MASVNYINKSQWQAMRNYPLRNLGGLFSVKIPSNDFEYKASGKLTSYSGGGVSGTITYDRLGRKLSETVNFGDFQKTFSYSYDSANNKTSYTSPEGVRYNYAYDNLDRLKSIAFGGKTINYNYNWNRLTKKTLPNGISEDYLHNANSWLSNITAKNSTGTLLGSQYAFDKLGNITERNSQDGKYSYGYDNSYQLTGVDNPELPDEAYTYDKVGNRLTSQKADNWAHNVNNELTAYDATSYTYDNNGNTVSATKDGQTTNYIYNARGRLVQVELPDGRVAEYGYNAFGQRVSKKVEGEISYYLYSGEGLIGEYDASGSLKKAYGWLPDMLWGTAPLFMVENGQYYYYHNDYLGTPQNITDDSGSIVWSASYTAFGKALIDESSIITNNLRFPGQYYDEETGLHNNWLRYYDPLAGRYTMVDTIGLNGGDVNLFRYVQQNPVNFIDPWGLFTLVDAIIQLRKEDPTPFNKGWNSGYYSDEQIFNKWYELENMDKNKEWLKELIKCPNKIDICSVGRFEHPINPNENLWKSAGSANPEHGTAVYEMRSHPTDGGHATQCTYDSKGNKMTGQPEGGTADKVSHGLTFGHLEHDLKPWWLAKKLGREDDYYLVRPEK